MWHGIVKDVVSLVSSLFNCMVLLYFLYFKFNPGSVIFLQLSICGVCQRMNGKLTTGLPELHPIPVKAPWYMVGINFIGPLSPVAKDGSRYILTISDYFTKWIKWHLQWQVHCLRLASVQLFICTCSYLCM